MLPNAEPNRPPATAAADEEEPLDDRSEDDLPDLSLDDFFLSFRSFFFFLSSDPPPPLELAEDALLSCLPPPFDLDDFFSSSLLDFFRPRPNLFMIDDIISA